MDRRWMVYPLVVTGFTTLGCYGRLDGCCFVAGVRVATPQGPRPIEDLREGDAVYSWSTELGEVRVGRVIACLRRQTPRTLRIACGELVIEGVSPEHPFWDPARRTWRAADTLAEGESLLGWIGADAQPRAITRIESHDEATEVFNLTVEGEHNYFAEGLLVHNKTPDWLETGGWGDLADGFDSRAEAPPPPDIGPLPDPTAIVEWAPGDGGNGHRYQVRYADVLSWEDAVAEALTVAGDGERSYIASLTSAEEQAFVRSLVPSARVLYLGARRTELDGPPTSGWAWVSGEPWDYTDWADGFPLAVAADDALAWIPGEGWVHDLPDFGALGYGYVVEIEDETP